jgi:hypothetical protein
MNGSEQYHQPVLEALCAFVREGTIALVLPEDATGMTIGGGTATDILVDKL